MEGSYNSRTPEEVFRDFRARRVGIVKALTTEVEKFYGLCDPGAGMLGYWLLLSTLELASALIKSQAIAPW